MKKRNGLIFGATALLVLTACGTQVSSQGGNAVVAQAPISEAQVKEIVAKETGLHQLVYEKIILKTDDNRRVYEVDAFLDGKEYDFDIDATTGAIIASNKEGQLQRQNQHNANEQVIDEARVKQIVSEKTQEPVEKLQFVRIQLTQDDDYNRAKVYEVEAFSETKDYDLDVHALTGEVLKFESEAYQGISQPQPHQIPQSPNYAQQPAVQQQAARQTATISDVQARDIAAKHSGVGHLTFRSVYLSNEDDYGYRPVYQVDAYADGWEYDFDIDAATGQVLSFDKDYLD